MAKTYNKFSGFTSLKEARMDASGKGLAEVRVIQPGFNVGGGRFYPSDVLKRDHGIFEGAHMNFDHPSKAQERERPEGSIHDWAGVITNVRVDESGNVFGSPKIHSPILREMLANMAELGTLGEMGISIRGSGQIKEGTIDGKTTGIVESLDEAYSVDFVTFPGAGGRVQVYESANTDKTGDLEMDTDVKERFEAIEASMTGLTATLNTVAEAVTAVTESLKGEGEPAQESATPELDAAKAELAEAQGKLKAAEARTGIVEAINESKLPQVAKARLIEAHGDSGDLEAAQAAIVAESEYLSKVSPKSAVRGLGETGSEKSEGVTEAARAEQVAYYKATYLAEGKSIEDAAVMAENRVGNL
jgi:hypothetical protein